MIADEIVSGLTLIVYELVYRLTMITDIDGARVNSKQACVWIDIDS